MVTGHVWRRLAAAARGRGRHAGVPRPGGGDARRRRAGTRSATALLVTIEVAAFVVGPALGGLLLHP